MPFHFFSIRQDALVCRPNRAQKPLPIRWNEAKRSVDRRSYLAALPGHARSSSVRWTRLPRSGHLQRYTRRQMSKQR